jgi:tetratricopeptide (TPR) repeat protein
MRRLVITIAWAALVASSAAYAVGREDARPSVEGSTPAAPAEEKSPLDNIVALKRRLEAGELPAGELAALMVTGNEEGRYEDVTALADVALGTPASVVAAAEAARAAAARAEERRTGEPAELPESREKFYAGLEPYRADARIWNEAGVAYYMLNRAGDAKACYDAARARDPAFDEPHVNLGLLYRRKGWYEQALAEYDAALALNPAKAITWYNRAVSLLRLGRVEDAVASLERAAALAPKYRPPVRRLALLWYDLGDYETAYGYAKKLSYLVKTDAGATPAETADAEEILTLCENRILGKKAQPALTVEGTAGGNAAEPRSGGRK